jgi:Carbohydrate binding module (family 6)/Fibronectin type III domain/Right handed beta helix region
MKSKTRHFYFVLIVGLFILSISQTVLAVQPVTWINQVNVTVTGNTIQKNTGVCPECDNAGAISQQQINSGNGYVEFTTTSDSNGYIGLGTNTTNSTSNLEINYGIGFGGGGWVIRELNYTYRIEGTYTVGDTFRISVVGTQVKYYKNGTTEIYTSTVAPTYPLVVDTSLWYTSGTVTSKIPNVMIETGQAQPVPTPPTLISNRCSSYSAPTVPTPLKTFYIDAANGNDSNDGFSNATAWKTLIKANNSAIAGDLFLLRGTFTDQWINPTNSGTSTNKITFRKEPGQSAILEWISSNPWGIFIAGGQSHIVIDGLEIRNTPNPFQITNSSNNIWLRNLYIHDSGGSTFRAGANNNRLEDSVLVNIGSDQDNSGDSLSLLYDTDNNVVVRNYFGNAGHAAYDDGLDGSSVGYNENNIVAQNIFENKWASNVIFAGRAVGTLVECNVMKNATQTSQFNYPRMGIQLDGKSNIIRYNLLYNNKADGIIIEGRVYAGQQMFAENNQIYQNTFVSNGRSGIFMDIRDLGNDTGTNAYIRNNVIENNIFWNDVGNSPSNGTNAEIVVSFYYANSQWAAGFTDGNIFRYNNFSNIPAFNFTGVVGNGNFVKSTPAELQATYSTWTNNRQQDPLFTNSATNDYSLLSTSPMINVGRLIPGVVYNGSAPDLGAIETTVASQSPYPGPSVPNVPLTIEAENYDSGGETVSYHDADTGNNGGVYRTNDVDIQARATANNGYEVFNAAAGEWLEYTVNVPTAGYYDIGVRYASAFTNGTFHVEVDGTNVTGTMTAVTTGSWSTFQTLTKQSVNLTVGNHVIRLVLDTNSPDGCACIVADFDSLSFSATPVPTAPSGLVANVLSTTSIKLDWVDNSNNETSFIVQRCSGSTTCTTFATVAGGTLAANAITFTNTALTNGTIYRYRIGAVNAVGTNYSNIATITLGIPTAPTSLTATAIAGKKVNLAWSSSANNVTNFQSQRCAGTTSTCTATSTNWVNASLTIPGTTLSYQDSGLTAGTTYRYRVRAVNGAGNSAYVLTTSTVTALP